MTTNPDVVSQLRRLYPEGTRVELLFMDDFNAPPPGTKGTVWRVDDLGTIHVNWDNGQQLGIAYGIDDCKIIHDRERDEIAR